ncbi:SubName: Full=Uncharacterized protein {ECO:0000313/EMBL:CCA66399.1} [Serendipita indica DSM 11827]|uniref:Mitochondrial carrier n=1 Tax=Serendipita indica (strain DSM 11827) TaxID=1109443 RepID=G4T4X6_SERID|nr:SubName: Full=Uncharacterized protein {ECO:0000313/EMBL:CCA66399.1} [Serendipita indica DSM 11827]CCA66399.1 hypothetical protein PIIN_00085 [Serendipita indica DSM 11827]
MADIILPLLIVLIAGWIGLLVQVPFTGALIRFRANYTPKGLQLDSEGQAQPYVGPVVSNYFAMLRRILRIEGWPGFWKGYVPSAISSILVVIFVGFIGATIPKTPGASHSITVVNSFHLILYAAFLSLLSTPFTILINRAITTPHRLPWFGLRKSLRVLLTPYELHRPWMLYFEPGFGLLIARSLHVSWLVFVQRGVRRILLPSLNTDIILDGTDNDVSDTFSKLSPVALGFYIFFVILSSIAVLTPLEVISVRLSVQRNHSEAAGFGPAPQDEEDPELEYAGREEDVIALRPEEDPYEGFLHCAKSILQEEGPETLLRGWWITLLASLAGAFS